MLTQQTGAHAAETIGTVTQVYGGTLTSDVQVHMDQDFFAAATAALR
jgi:hypothetical protein